MQRRGRGIGFQNGSQSEISADQDLPAAAVGTTPNIHSAINSEQRAIAGAKRALDDERKPRQCPYDSANLATVLACRLRAHKGFEWLGGELGRHM